MATKEKDKTEKILERLFSLRRFGIKPGLGRTRKLLETTGNPQNKFPSIHVAGTNGKGAVCSLLASVLSNAGYKTGLYTSPHISRFNERIKINGAEISDKEIIRLAEKYLEAQKKIGATFFETTTAMAFDYFADNKVDIAVVETGMGGRFDSTNVLYPILSIIASIDLDHRRYLGETLAQIANEKAGIIKSGADTIISDDNPNIRTVFTEKAKKRKSKIHFCSDFCSSENVSCNGDFTMTLDVKINKQKYENIKSDIPGEGQIKNIFAALTAFEILKAQFPVSRESVLKGLRTMKKRTGFRGRLDLIRKDPPLILDVGHNPGAVGTLVKTIENCGYKSLSWNVIFAAMSDKNADALLNILKPLASKLILTQPKTDRAFSADELKAVAERLGISNAEAVPDVAEAVYITLKENAPTIISGSFFLAEEALPALEKIDNNK